MFKNQAR